MFWGNGLKMYQSKINTATETLRIIREIVPEIGVAFSGGKDSFATLDLCSKYFRRVEAYYLFRVRGLRCISELCNFVKQRWGITVRHYPHWDLRRCYKNAVLRQHIASREIKKTLGYDWNIVEDRFRADAQVRWIAYGWRRNDSFSRALILKRNSGIDFQTNRVFPIFAFTRAEVLKYLQRALIPTPPSFGRVDQGGVDFHPATLAFLKNQYPDDYEKLVREFPFAPIQEIRNTN